MHNKYVLSTQECIIFFSLLGSLVLSLTILSTILRRQQTGFWWRAPPGPLWRCTVICTGTIFTGTNHGTYFYDRYLNYDSIVIKIAIVNDVS